MAEDELSALLDRLRTLTGEVEGDLPEPLFAYALQIVPTINVDLLVNDKAGRTLLAWRDDEYGAGWHIPGGVIRRYETFAERIAACADDELGLVLKHEDQPCYVLDNGRSYRRGHFISLLFRCAPASPFQRMNLFGDRDHPRNGELAWFVGAPPDLYVTHRAYPDWIWSPV